jgi:hypothetical protein
MTIDFPSLMVGAASVVGLFLLQWAGKHFLDAFVLPRIRDWWAGRSKKAALQMAGEVLKQSETEARDVADVRFLLLRVYRMISAIALSATIFITLMLILIALGQNVPGSEERGFSQAMLLIVPALYALWLFGVRYEYTRLDGMMQNPAKHREEMITRLRKLLKGGGFTENEIEEWLKSKVPQILAERSTEARAQ